MIQITINLKLTKSYKGAGSGEIAKIVSTEKPNTSRLDIAISRMNQKLTTGHTPQLRRRNCSFLEKFDENRTTFLLKKKN